MRKRAIPLFAAVLLTACGGGGLSGTYADTEGLMSLEFTSSSKVRFTTPSDSRTVPYKLKGQALTLGNGDGGSGELILTLRPDRQSIEGPLGIILIQQHP